MYGEYQACMGRCESRMTVSGLGVDIGDTKRGGKINCGDNSKQRAQKDVKDSYTVLCKGR